MVEENFDNLWILVAGIAGSLIGVIVGAYVTLVKEKQREKGEIEKIRMLINDDYQRIDQFTILSIMTIQDLIKSIESDDTLIEKIMDTSTEHTFPDDMKHIVFDYRYSFWNAINQSGSLIKLDIYEIRALQSYNDFSIQSHEQFFETYKKITGAIRTIKHNKKMSKDQKKSEIKKYTLTYLSALLLLDKGIWKIIQEHAEKISWINLLEMKEDSDEKDIDEKGSYVIKKENLRDHVLDYDE